MQQFFTDLINTVTGFLSTLRINDLVDVLIVAFIIYKVIHLVRETRAEQLIKGLFLIAVVYFAATVFRLSTLSFLMNMLVNYGVIALIVVFQPELRRALEKMGRSRISKLVANRDVGEEELEQRRAALGEIARAAQNMSKSRTGALIVFERETKLGEIINTGTVVNADPKTDLIENIFYPKAPLHDGAMIIRDFRVHSAGCFLPLSQNYEISRELGTRHRAALGISENSDAVALVVSEETGTISIAHNGRLARGVDGAALTSVLEKLLLGEMPVKLKGFLAKRGGKKHE